MTMRELLIFFENYYGEKYAGIVLDTMTAYLDGYSPEFYKAAANVIVRRFSRTFNKAPGPAELERNMTEILMEAQRPKGEWLPEPKDVIAPGEREESLQLIEEIKKRCNHAVKGTLANALSKTISRLAGLSR